MADDVVDDFVAWLAPAAREIAQRLTTAIRASADLDVAIKWRQLTFASDSDYDHWICAVAPTNQRVNLTFHYGKLLRDDAGLFEASDAKFVRKIGYKSSEDVDDAAVGELVSQAIAALPTFKQVARVKD